MNFTGTELIQKRNFYAQDLNFEIDIDLSFDTFNTAYYVGLSGGASLFEIKFESGYISYNNIKISNYQVYKDFNINIQITSGNFNILKDENPLIYGGIKQTGYFDYAYFKRSNLTQNADFSFLVSGSNLASYGITERGLILTTGQGGVTGIISNFGNHNIRIFDSTVLGSQGFAYIEPTGDVFPLFSKNFIFTGDFDNDFNFNQYPRIILNTNFGDINFPFHIIDARSLNNVVVLDDISDFSFNFANIITRTQSYLNFSGGAVSNNFNAEISVSLDYIAGSGESQTTDFTTGTSYFTTGYGNLYQSGYLTGIANINTGAGFLTGILTILPRSFAWATGDVTGYFSGVATGLASGIGYTGRAVGFFSGNSVGTISDGSGTFLFNSYETGIGYGQMLSLDYSSYINSTGFINISGIGYDDFFYIGVDSTPIIMGVQFNDDSSFVSYLSGNNQHKVRGIVQSPHVIQLNSLFSGTLGNGIFVHQGNCSTNSLTSFSPFLTGGLDVGTTGNLLASLNQPFSGAVYLFATGSGNYSSPISGIGVGVFTYTRTFNGTWSMFTGVNSNQLVKLSGNAIKLSGNGILPPNSGFVFQIVHNDSPFNVDTALLTISGGNVINPEQIYISQ